MILTMKRGIFITKSLWVSKEVVIQVVLFVDFTNQKYCWCREGFIWKKVVKFHNFGPDLCPPPLKVMKSQFYFYSITRKPLQNKKNSPLKTQKNFLKSQYLVDNCLSFQSIIFIADLDELEHAKKNFLSVAIAT